MRRPDRGPSRRERRAAIKGVPTGRRVTHRVLTTRGRHTKVREWDALMAVVFAARKDATP